MRPRWLRTRDDPAELRRAVKVMITAGYPHIEAQREFIRYRGQVREAIASTPAVALAGLLSGVSIALAVVAVFAVGALLLAAVQTAATGGSSSAPALSPQPTAQPTAPPQRTPLPGSAAADALSSGLRLPTPPPAPRATAADDRGGASALLGFLPVVGVLAPVLGVAGVGVAFVERLRRRREGAHRTFLQRTPNRAYLAFQFLVWTGLMGISAGLVFTFAGSSTAGAFIGLMIVIGFPVSFVFRYYFYRTYPTFLAIASQADAGSYARSVIESSFETPDTPRAPVRPEATSKIEPPNLTAAQAAASAGGGIKGSYVATFVGGFAVWWGLVRWSIWWAGGGSLMPFSGDLMPDFVGIVVGLIVGFLLTQFYSRYIE